MIGDELDAVGHAAAHAAFQAHAIAAIDHRAVSGVLASTFRHRSEPWRSSAAARCAAASSSQRAPFSAVAGRGSPITPLGAMSRVSHAKVAGAFSGSSSSRLGDVRDVVDRVRRSVDEFRHRGQQQRRFHFARVKSVGAFLRAEAFELHAARAVQRKRAQAEFGAQIARHHVDQRGVSAVRVVEDELAGSRRFAMLDPRSRSTAMNVVALTESVPGKPICSLLLP